MNSRNRRGSMLARRFLGGLHLIALAMMALLEPRLARADFDVCNAGSQVSITVAWAEQEVSLFNPPYSVHGWQNLNPGVCRRLASGNVSGHAFWFHAEARGVVLTADYATNGHGDDKQFCISDKAFNADQARTVNDASDCAPSERIATFPIWSYNPMYADHQIDFHPDTVKARKPQQANSRGEYMPSLFGAVALDSTAITYTAFFHDSAEEAQSNALTVCRNTSGVPATCQVRLEFADQCAGMLRGDKDPIFLFTGNKQAEEQETREWAMGRCRARGNTKCEDGFLVCSTVVGRAAHRKKIEDETNEKILTGIGKALEEIWRQ